MMREKMGCRKAPGNQDTHGAAVSRENRRQTQNSSERTLPKLKTGLRLGVKGAVNARQK